MGSASGARGDPKDAAFGGYNLNQAGIVCDIKLPGGLPELVQAEPPTPTAATSELSYEASSLIPDAFSKPAMLFFGPPNDPSMVRTLLPRLREMFDVDWVDSSLDGVHAVANRSYVALVAKLGTKGNSGVDVVAALREIQGQAPFVAIHSGTAAGNQDMQAKLKAQYKCDLFVSPSQEEDLLDRVRPLVVPTNKDVSNATVLNGANSRSGLLLFGPPNDPEMVHRVMPRLSLHFDVTHVESAEKGVEAISLRPYHACVAKLGTENNLGVNVIKAFRSAYGREPFVAVHSSTAAADASIQKALQDQFHVDLCVSPAGESALIAALAERVHAF
jgi:DNA-binding response OmpR family regulator